MLRLKFSQAVIVGGLAWLSFVDVTAAESTVDFARDIRPILSDNCYACHGPDEQARQAELRLDRQEDLTAEINGHRVVSPGEPQQSELFRRISSSDDERMPPAETGRSVNADQIALIRRWIEQGAKWQPHWSFTPPQRSELPKIKLTQWPRNAIDYFVLARLEQDGLAPSSEADKSTLLRRVTLDLTGLPPKPEEVDAFLADSAADAYERVVDRLLASPRYGERMALDWLDAARFADSDGYQGDGHRTMWPWRDWVIRALNANMPFNQFTLEQLAGDLLPGSTSDQRIATGFHRNHRHNDEDGIIPEEFLVEYVADRTETTATVWLGLTVGCARCHDHKYDPITQREYYQLFAYFNNIAEKGRAHGNAAPIVQLASQQQKEQLTSLDRQIENCRSRLAANPADAAPKTEMEQLEKQRKELENSIPTTMVLQELSEPRQTHLLKRGVYDQPGDAVAPAVPAVLSPSPTDAPVNRLGLAKWLIDPAHPLTARVTVNRYWQLFFGQGLVRTPDDFGSQGERSTHPELLDWLAVEFMQSDWNVKAMHRLIVTSATYRQSSPCSPQLLEKDPENRLLTRAPRLRLSAQAIRDQALAASGLLVEQIGGPSVMPYQPAGIWEDVASTSSGYQVAEGRDLYRRSLYTFWKRTVTPPAMAVFDASSRETCTVRQRRTNTPLQALVLMNDVTYVEAARRLAERVMQESPESPDRQLPHMFLLVLGRQPAPDEAALLKKAWNEYRTRFANCPDEARKLVAAGKSPHDPKFDAMNLAAHMVIASTILNLDETITRE